MMHNSRTRAEQLRRPTNLIQGDILVWKRGVLFEYVQPGCPMEEVGRFRCTRDEPITVLELKANGDLKYQHNLQCLEADEVQLAPPGVTARIAERRRNENDGDGEATTTLADTAVRENSPKRAT